MRDDGRGGRNERTSAPLAKSLEAAKNQKSTCQRSQRRQHPWAGSGMLVDLRGSVRGCGAVLEIRLLFSGKAGAQDSQKAFPTPGCCLSSTRPGLLSRKVGISSHKLSDGRDGSAARR